jgi:hypothetical protein
MTAATDIGKSANTLTPIGLREFLRNSFSLIKAAIWAWIDDSAQSMGAALSYYTIFSLAPLLLIVMSIAGLVFGEEAARGELFLQLRSLMGSDAAATVESLLAVLNKPSENIGASVVGVSLLLIGATSVFGELQNSLDRIWRVPVKRKKSGLWKLLRERFLSLGLILGLAFLLMVSLVIGAVLSALGKWWAPIFGAWEMVMQLVHPFDHCIRDDIQVNATCAHSLARCLDWCVGYFRTFYCRKIFNQLIHWPQRCGFKLWRGRVNCGHFGMGLLLSTNFFHRCRIHMGVCTKIWLDARSACLRRCKARMNCGSG